MELPQSNTLLPVCSYTRTELLSLRTKTSSPSLSTVDRLKDLNIGYHLPRRHRSSRRVKRKKHNLHSFIVASFNAQSVKGNDMACKRCEISTFIKDNGVDLFFVTETWLSAQGDEAKTAELAPSGFDVKSFPRQSRSRGGGIATVYKSTLGSCITFITSFDFTHTSFEVVQASITLQHNTLHFFCLYRPPPNRRNNLTDSMFTEQLPDLLDYVNSLPGLVCLVGDMNIHFDNPLQSLTKQTLSTLSLYGLVQVINKPTHRCGHIIDWVIVRPDDDIHRKYTVIDSLESDHYCAKSYFNISVSKPSTLYRTVRIVNDLFLSLNKGNISVLALLYFSSAFDTIDHTILVHRLHTDFGFTYTALQWFSSYLTNRTHYVSLCNNCSDFAPVHSVVPQGSVLGPMLFTMFIKPLSAIIDSHSIIHHSFDDDLQLQMSAPPDRISELLHSMQSCISDVKAWATANMLKLYDSKTELMLVTSKRSKHLHNLPTSITIGNAQIPFKQSVKNLGFTLDCHLTMNANVSNIARTCYFEQSRLASMRRFLTSTATATLVSAFVLSRIDYCNSLLFVSTNDVTSHLQRIQNYAARVIFRLPMSSSITIHLKSLHWLPVKVRSTYKIACLCYHCHSSTAPSYVTDMLHKKPLHTRNTRSSAYTMPLLNRPAHSKATLGDRSFCFASSSVWNSIPNDVRCAPSLSSFKSRLKTYLFRSVYID